MLGQSQSNRILIIVESIEIRLYIPFSDWFGTKYVWIQTNQKMLNTIWFRVDLIRFRKYFSLCVLGEPQGLRRCLQRLNILVEYCCMREAGWGVSTGWGGSNFRKDNVSLLHLLWPNWAEKPRTSSLHYGIKGFKKVTERRLRYTERLDGAQKSPFWLPYLWMRSLPWLKLLLPSVCTGREAFRRICPI